MDAKFSLLELIIAWALGLASSFLVFFYQRHADKIDRIKNFITLFESLKEDWEEFRNSDDLHILRQRLEMFLTNIEIAIPFALAIQDKKATSFIFNNRKYCLKFIKNIENGHRGHFHYRRDELNLLFEDRYFYDLHEKYCRCALRLNNVG
jgi:hypothetical protein